MATDKEQTVVWRWDSDAFGDSKADTDVDGDGKKVNIRLRFPGQYYDGESKLHYNQHRDYDPKTGRYIQSDPLGLAGGLSTYVYTEGNPVSFIDPLGLSCDCREGGQQGSVYALSIEATGIVGSGGKGTVGFYYNTHNHSFGIFASGGSIFSGQFVAGAEAGLAVTLDRYSTFEQFSQGSTYETGGSLAGC